MLISLLHNLPDFKGKRRIAKWLLGEYLKTTRDTIINGAGKLKFKLPNVIETIGFEILVNGVYEKETSDFIISHIPANGVFLDVGANIGAIAFPVCHKRKDIKTICIEASPRVFEYLKYNKDLNRIDNCTLLNNAVGESNGQMVSFYSPAEQFGKGSLSSVFTDNAEHVEMITIDSLLEKNNIKKVDFIKIDVEGYEYHAFKGAQLLFSDSTAPDMLFEFVDWAENLAKDVKPGDSQLLLKSFGYNIYSYSPKAGFTPIDVLTTGSALLFATKKTLVN
jgi:FkbM family methyltransferase